MVLDGVSSRRDIELHRAAQEVVGVQEPENEVDVGDGGPGSTGPVGRRTRVGARTIRTDLE
jgi:hypothetical protein